MENCIKKFRSLAQTMCIALTDAKATLKSYLVRRPTGVCRNFFILRNIVITFTKVLALQPLATT